MQSIQCLQCIHFEGNTVCRAFPQGIPESIWDGTHDHHAPYKGDNGITFLPVKAGKSANEPDESNDTQAVPA